MKKQFYVHLSSDDSKEYFTENNSSKFTVILPEQLHLTGSWEVALCAISYPKLRPKPNKILICSDICSESIIGEKRLPLLEVITGKLPASFYPRQYIPVRVQEVNQISVYIKDGSGALASFNRGTSMCTLHFKKST